MRNRIQKKQGTTLVELMVCMLLISILLILAVGIISPAFRIFVRIQRQQYAQMIVDNVADEIRGQTREAMEYVKIYENVTYNAATGVETGLMNGTSSGTTQGKDQGNLLEFVNSEGYVTLISAGGSPEMNLYRGETAVGETEPAIGPGRLCYRYYWWQSKEGQNNVYYLKDKSGKYIGRGMTKAFGDGYYMGNYLDIRFAFPKVVSGGTETLVADKDPVPYLELTVSLYSSPDRKPEELVAQESTILDLRYQPLRKNDYNTGVTLDTGFGP